MTVQIDSIVLYHADGRKRVVEFENGTVNVITGTAHTGKSAITSIVNYCMGHSNFNIPKGRIRNTVAWYAVLFRVNEGQLFIAKPPPEGDQASQSGLYFLVGTDIQLPDIESLEINSSDDALIEYFDSIIGIEEHLHEPDEDQTRKPIKTTIKHAQLLSFQTQHEVANPKILFHKQDETFVELALKDTIKYLFGALKPEHLVIKNKLKYLKRKLTLTERKVLQAEQLAKREVETVRNLISEAKEVGIVPADFDLPKEGDPRSILTEVVSKGDEIIVKRFLPEDETTSLRSELTKLRKEYKQTTEEIEFINHFSNDSNDFKEEATEQSTRLSTVNLFEEAEHEKCPLCHTQLSISIPAISQIQESLKSLSEELRSVDKDQRRATKYLKELTEKKSGLQDQIVETSEKLEKLQREVKEYQKLLQQESAISRVLGRVSLFLETIQPAQEDSEARSNVKEIENEMEFLEAELQKIDIPTSLASIQNEISRSMTKFSKEMDMEYSDADYILDIEKLDVLIDTGSDIIAMSKDLGSGANSLACHIITHLAIHKFLIQHERPAFNFLFLDQPSQTYFPEYETMTGEVDETKDTDLIAVSKMFKLMFDVCESLKGKLQIIVFEHANLPTEQFQSHLVEPRWSGSGNAALIPEDW